MARQLTNICLRQAWIILASPHVDRRIDLFEIFELRFVLLAYNATAPVKRPKLSQRLFILLLLVRCILYILNHLWFMKPDVTILLLLNAITRDKIGSSTSLDSLSGFSSLRNRRNHKVARLWGITDFVEGNSQCAVGILLSLLYWRTSFLIILYRIILIIKLLLNRIFLDQLWINLGYLLEFLSLLKVNARVWYQSIFCVRFVADLGYPLPVLFTNFGFLKWCAFVHWANVLVNWGHFLLLAVAQEKFGTRRLSMICLCVRR